MTLPTDCAACGLCPVCHQVHLLPYSPEARQRAQELCQILEQLLVDEQAQIPEYFHHLDLLPLAKSNEGKMVAVCQLTSGDWAYAISGQLQRRYAQGGFCDHVADHDKLADIAHRARVQINPLTEEIKKRQKAGRPWAEILPLKQQRRAISASLCAENQDLYRIASQNGILRPLPAIWTPPPQFTGHGIPTGVGDCALPKILQWANLHQQKPLAAAEFWWGGPDNRHAVWQNGTIIPACAEKCQGIMGYMLCSLDIN